MLSVSLLIGQARQTLTVLVNVQSLLSITTMSILSPLIWFHRYIICRHAWLTIVSHALENCFIGLSKSEHLYGICNSSALREDCNNNLSINHFNKHSLLMISWISKIHNIDFTRDKTRSSCIVINLNPLLYREFGVLKCHPEANVHLNFLYLKEMIVKLQ